MQLIPYLSGLRVDGLSVMRIGLDPGLGEDLVTGVMFGVRLASAPGA